MLNLALSLIPMTRIVVITSAMMKAGRFNPISTPNQRGAPSRSCARCNNSGDCALTIALTLSRNVCVPGTKEESVASAIWRATVFSSVFSAVQ